MKCCFRVITLNVIYTALSGNCLHMDFNIYMNSLSTMVLEEKFAKIVHFDKELSLFPDQIIRK